MLQTETKNSKQYDLEARTLTFARAVRAFIKQLPRGISNFEDSKQLVRSSGSIGANYIEANDCLGKKDFLLHARIARKEAKETRYWLQLVEVTPDLEPRRIELLKEATELMMILGAIVRKSEA